MKRKHRRLSLVVASLAALGAAVALILVAFEGNIVFFHSPTDLTEKTFRAEQRLRLGGLVEKGTVAKSPDGLTITFKITDLAHSVPVSFKGILPDLFRESQGVVAEGHYRDGKFIASEILAKHDETYMPREVADALRKSGQWRGPGEDGTKKKKGY
ncbi:MAG: cytochrome c maturation protein CcmE [Rhodospirillales bacterium]|nr:cytochrome c maturation protein CcmE [Rhodospirillales bacterium]